RNISDAVIKIRQSKLPDPKKIPNAGSFFKNPYITQEQFNLLKQQFPEIPHYDAPHSLIKIPAGWLIEQCGWKGKTLGNVG
ncbi:MAG: UDP-N-acetylmuramate dehydrogenase, partial [Coxiellaceae bacterium]|nr:UDP-N-acetylmuramate dehydrogenase [Coxiellaceae bacterium]